jgi:hypothetical protein
MKQLRYLGILLITLIPCQIRGQDIYLQAYKKISTGFSSKVDQISFSQDTKIISVTDEKGTLVILETESTKVLKKESLSGKVLFHDFLDKENRFLTVKASGEFYLFTANSWEKTKGSTVFSSPLYAVVDPSQGYLTVLEKGNQIQVFDLRAGMTQTRIQALGDVKNTLFVGFDRFGQQLAIINNIGETYSWEFLNQKFLRQLKLQSGEYSGSRSVVQTASASKGSDNFVVGLQEVFVPKGGLQPGRQPERRNMVIAYDWLTGQEKKRVGLQYRPDGIAMGPTPTTLTYYSTDTRTIFIVNMDKGEIRESVAVDERPSCIALSDDGSILAVGTVSGTISLFEVVRNNPAEIRIINPPVDRNLSEQTIRAGSIQIEGKVEGLDRVSQVFINDQKTELNVDGSFRSNVNLVPGRNRIRIKAQNTQSQVLVKDVYLNCEPDAIKNTGTDHVHPYNKRVALVIGNAEYATASKLRNTLNDAKSMALVLKSLEFEVIVIENGTYENMKNAIYSFGDRIQDVDVSIFFYAGHGLEVDGINYLVPVDADIQSHLDIKQKCIPLTGVTNTMEFANDEGLNMIILDACRNNPFPVGKRGGSGLARVNAPSGTLIAYATDPGSVASDGEGTNGLYTGELIKQLQISQRIEDVFMSTRNSVEHLSNGRQRPWEEARLKGVFYLK